MIQALKSFTDSDLIETLKVEPVSEYTIKYLYRSYYKGLSIYIQQNQGTEQDAEDVFQESLLTFIDLVKKDKFRGESSIKTFLYTLNRYTWLNELKKRGRSLLREEKYESTKDVAEMDVSHLVIARETNTAIMSTIGRLGEVCKKILVSYYYDNLSIKEILPEVNYQNEQVLRNKKYKCLKQLEQMLTANPLLAKQFKNALTYGQ